MEMMTTGQIALWLMFSSILDAGRAAQYQRWTVLHQHAAHYVSCVFWLSYRGDAGRPKAWQPLSEGISPVQGTDRRGPTAVIKSASKMDHALTGGTLLNMKFSPKLLEDEAGINNLAHLVRTYFKLGGHHVQFNVVKAETLRKAQADPDAHRDL